MRESKAKGFFWNWGLLMYERRRTVVTVWLLLFLGLGVFATQTQGLLRDNGFTPKGSESEQGLALLEEQLGATGSYMQVVYESESLDLTSPERKTAIMNSLASLSNSEELGEPRWLEESRVADKKHIAAVEIPILLGTDEALDRYPHIREQIPELEGMEVYVTGGTPVLHDMQEASQRDIMKAEIIGIPIALVVLLVIFGTVLAALLPLIVGLVSVAVTLGIVYFAALEFSLSNFLPNIVTMLGLAVGIDYALFMVSRFREELKKRGTAEAVAMTSQTAGKSIFFSGAAVLIGLFGMLFIPLNFFQSLCLGGVLVVSVSVIVANTLLLSLMGLFGALLNRWHVLPKAWCSSDKEGLAWRKIATGVMRRPILLSLFITAALIAMMLPIFDMQLGVPNAEVLPPAYESRYGADLLYEAFDRSELEPVQIAVRADSPFWTPEAIGQARQLTARLSEQEGVGSVNSYVGIIPAELADPQAAATWLQDERVMQSLAAGKMANEHYFVVQAVSEYEPYSPANESLVERLREVEVEGLDLWVSGSEAYRHDIIGQINRGIPYVLAFVMGVTYIVLMFAFRSVILPIKAVVMNVFSLGASLGIVVQVFQHGRFAELLQVTSIGYVNATLPVLIFCVVFGISMDYEVFLISRMMEEYEATGDNEHSTAEGLMKTGSLITSAALILVVVVGTFIFTDIEIMKALGLGLSLAVFLDATIVRALLVPALMKLLGRANWWGPRWLKPIRPGQASNPSKS